MKYWANAFIFKRISLLVLILSSMIVLSACDNDGGDKNAKRDTENSEINPLGNYQKAHEVYSSKRITNDNQQTQSTYSNTSNIATNASETNTFDNSTTNDNTNTADNNTDATDNHTTIQKLPEHNVTITLYSNITTSSISFCQFAILEVDSASYSTSSHKTDFDATTYKQLSNLKIGASYLGGVLLYLENMTVQSDLTDNYLLLQNKNLSSLNFNSKTYYPLAMCKDNSGVTLYSEYEDANSLTEDVNGNVSDILLSFVVPVKRTVEHAQPNPSHGLFTTDLTFNAGVSIPDESCQYIILQVDKNYDKRANLAHIFTTALTNMSNFTTTAPHNSFLNGTVVSTNNNETLYQDPLGQIYLSTNVPTHMIDMHAYDYYPIVICKNNLYSDFINTTAFTSHDGLNVDVNNVKIERPVITLQPNDDIIFGDSTTNLANAHSAFNENGSQYNFVLDLGNLPSPETVKNGVCDYAVAIDYSTALASHATPQLPQTLADFQSLYPGGSFGNSDKIIAVAKNPLVHAGSQAGHYIGMRLSLPKPVTNYINVAYCTLGGDNAFAGYTLPTDPTFNRDIAQVLHFDVKIDFPLSKGINITAYKDVSVHPSYAGRIEIVPDNTLTDLDIKAIGKNGCNGYFSIIASSKPLGYLNGLSASSIGGNSYNPLMNALTRAFGANNWYATVWPSKTGPSHFDIGTDYQKLYLIHGTSDTNGEYTSSKQNSNSLTVHNYFMYCDFGSGKFVTDTTSAYPLTLSQSGNGFSVFPSVYTMHVTKIR